MLKIRLTYKQEQDAELQETLEIINSNFNVLNQSREYKGRGKSKYSNVYIDVDLIKKEERK